MSYYNDNNDEPDPLTALIFLIVIAIMLVGMAV